MGIFAACAHESLRYPSGAPLAVPSGVTNARQVCASVLWSALLATIITGCPDQGVGDPCIPEDEYQAMFSGFTLGESYIESGSLQCKSRICLVNGFQGRVSCPGGQKTPETCQVDGDCSGGDRCLFASAIHADCDPTACGSPDADPNNCNRVDGGNAACGDLPCDADRRLCRCRDDGDCPGEHRCETNPASTEVGRCVLSVCSRGNANDDTTHCYLPGTDTPVAVEVKPQCDAASKRSADDAVYCSCRCGPPDNGPLVQADIDYDYCSCPEGFVCSEVRARLGLGDENLAGKYCVKVGTEPDPTTSCE